MKLIIFNAGSIHKTLEKIAYKYKEIKPNIEIILESNGSIEIINKVIIENRLADIIVSADYIPIELLMFNEYATWTLKFASNKMVLLYTDKSKFSDKINENNWYDIISKDDVKIGGANPDIDPAGYRAYMCMKLTEKYYNKVGLYKLLSDKNIVVKTKTKDELLSGNIDYSFGYESNAKRNNFKYISLPDEINLSNFNLEDYYFTESIKAFSKKINAEAIKYGMTIPLNSKHKEIAIDFIKFMVSEVGRNILVEEGLTSLDLLKANDYSELPLYLKEIIQGNITSK